MKSADRRMVAVFLLFGIAFLSAIFAVQGALLNSMIDAYGLRASNQGAANAAAFAGGIAALLTAFFLQGRRRKRALLKASTALCAGATALLWLAPNYAIFCVVWFVVGFALAMMDTLLSSCMADLYTGESGTRMLCVLHTTFGLASVLTPMGYQAMLSAGIPWKRVYLLLAVCGAALLAVAAAVQALRRIPDPEVLSASAVSLGDIAGGIRTGRLAWFVLAMLFHGVFLSGLNTWINRYALSLQGGGTIPAQSFVFLGIMLSRLLFPLLPVKTERYVQFGGLLGCAALSAGLCSSNGLVMRVSLLGAGLLVGALIPCIISLGCDRLRENTLLPTTAVMLSMYAGQAISSPIIASLESAFSLRAGIALCAVCMALCSACCVLDARSVKGSPQRHAQA